MNAILCDDCQDQEDAAAILLLKNQQSFLYKTNKVTFNAKGKPQKIGKVGDDKLGLMNYEISICESDK